MAQEGPGTAQQGSKTAQKSPTRTPGKVRSQFFGSSGRIWTAPPAPRPGYCGLRVRFCVYVLGSPELPRP
eukprot:5509535-Pyramimonas_sp.AAC.1